MTFAFAIITAFLLLPPQTKKAAQECTPPIITASAATTDTLTGGVALSTGGVSYRCSPEGKWVRDEAAMKWRAEEREHRRKLYWALRTRVLTVAEMEEVEQFGIALIRKRLLAMSILLAFRASADVLDYFILRSWGGDAYGEANWTTKGIQWVILCVIATQLCAEMAREWDRRKIWLASFLVGIAGTAAILHAIANADTATNRFLDSLIAADMILGLVILLGFLGSEAKLKSHWKWIAAGLIVSLVAESGFTFAWKIWEPARHLYPLGAASALLVWNWGLAKKVRLGEYRLDLGKKLPVSVQVEEEKKWVM